MRVARVLIAGLPDLQADVLATLVRAEPDMVVVGVRGSGPLPRGPELEADVVLVPPGYLAHALTERAQPSLVGLARSGVELLAVDAASGNIFRAAVAPDEQSWSHKVIAAIRDATPPRAQA
jgi:hypothetical protein